MTPSRGPPAFEVTTPFRELSANGKVKFCENRRPPLIIPALRRMKEIRLPNLMDLLLILLGSTSSCPTAVGV
jgi:hypothetical protein